MLEEIIRDWGHDPEAILVKEALAEPHRTVCGNPAINQEKETTLLGNALKEILKS